MYKAKIIKTQENSFFALVVLVHKDGFEQVVRNYKSRHFATMKAAEKSTSKFIASI
jgi:hypothetical protein